MATRCGSSSLFAILAVSGLSLVGVGGYNAIVRGCPMAFCDHKAQASAKTTLVAAHAAKHDGQHSGGCPEMAAACHGSDAVVVGCSESAEKATCPMAKIAECKDGSKGCDADPDCKDAGACGEKKDAQVAQKPAK